MSWNDDTNKRRPSVKAEKRDRGADGQKTESPAPNQPESQSDDAPGMTQRIDHVEISLDEIRKARQSSLDAGKDASGKVDSETATALSEPESAVVGQDALSKASSKPEKESAGDPGIVRKAKGDKPLTSKEALVAFAAASAREVPAPKQKKRIPASLLKGLFSASSDVLGEDDSVEMIAYDEKVLKATAEEMAGEAAPAEGEKGVSSVRSDRSSERRKRLGKRGEGAAARKGVRSQGRFPLDSEGAKGAREVQSDGIEQASLPIGPSSEDRIEGFRASSCEEPGLNSGAIAVSDAATRHSADGASSTATHSQPKHAQPFPETPSEDPGAEAGASVRDSSAEGKDSLGAPSENAEGSPEGEKRAQDTTASSRPTVAKKRRFYSENRKPRRKIDRRKLHRRIAIAAASLAAVLALSIAIACFGFGAHLTKNITLEDENLSQALVPVQQKEEPFYTLVAVEYDRTSRYYEGPELLVLVRVDPANRIATLLSVPPETQVSLSDSEYHSVSEAQVIGGDAYLVDTVGQLFNVDIAHFVRTDDTGLANIVDRFGGIEVEVVADVNASDSADEADPNAAEADYSGVEETVPSDGGEAEEQDSESADISKGKQTLDGKSVVALTREDAYEEDPVGIRSQNQLNVISVLLEKCVESSGKDYSSTLSDLKNDFKTDMTALQLRSLLNMLSGEEGYKTYSAVLPGEYDPLTGGYLRDKTATRLMVVGIEENGNPADRDESKVDKASVFIEVQNGTNIEGGASDLRKKLRDKGWNVSFIGNNPNEDEPETLIIYGDEEMKAAAEEVAKDLGVGRVSSGEEGYTFGTDILVVLGLDWEEPASQGEQETEGA